MRRALFAVLALIATPVLADGTTLTIDNRSSEPVVRLNTFPIDDDGVPVEDNLGALMDDIAPGAQGRIDLSITRCMPVYVALGLGAGARERELTTIIDTCKSRTLVVSD